MANRTIEGVSASDLVSATVTVDGLDHATNGNAGADEFLDDAVPDHFIDANSPLIDALSNGGSAPVHVLQPGSISI